MGPRPIIAWIRHRNESRTGHGGFVADASREVSSIIILAVEFCDHHARLPSVHGSRFGPRPLGGRSAGWQALIARALHADVMAPGRIGRGEVGPGVHAAGLFALAGGGDHQPGRDQHVLHGPSGGVVKDGGQDVPAPVVDLDRGLLESSRGAGDAHLPPHQGTQRFPQVVEVDPGPALLGRDPGLDGGNRRDFELPGASLLELANDVSGYPRPVDQALEQAVGRQPVGPVQARAGNFAGCPQAGKRGPARCVDRHAPDHVMGARADRNGVARDVQVEALAEAVDSREPLANEIRVKVREIEINVGMKSSGHLAGDRQRHFVAGGKLGQGMILGHEPVAVLVPQVGPFAAQGLGQEMPRRAGHVEHGRMKLHELHVAQLDPRAVGHRVAIGRGDWWIGRLAVKLPRAAGGQDNGPRPDQGEPAPLVPDQDASAASLMGEQIDRRAVLPDPDRPP